MESIVKVQTSSDLFKHKEQTHTPARQIFGNFLFENEIGVLFGDSNTGKSYLAMDIAIHAAGGVNHFDNLVSPNVPTMYIDMELTTKQFVGRYQAAADNDYIPNIFSRAEVDTLNIDEKNILTYVRLNIIRQQHKHNAPKFIIIDNITNGFGNVTSASNMRKLISELKSLKERFGLTFLLIAHCPKRKPLTPITQNDLGGSKMLINFCDSAFAIGTSVRGEDFRYIKQIKTREGKKSDTVTTIRFNSEPYTHFEYYEEVPEDWHFKTDAMSIHKNITPENESILVDMWLRGANMYQISEATGIPTNAIVQYAIINNLNP